MSPQKNNINPNPHVGGVNLTNRFQVLTGLAEGNATEVGPNIWALLRTARLDLEDEKIMDSVNACDERDNILSKSFIKGDVKIQFKTEESMRKLCRDGLDIGGFHVQCDTMEIYKENGVMIRLFKVPQWTNEQYIKMKIEETVEKTGNHVEVKMVYTEYVKEGSGFKNGNVRCIIEGDPNLIPGRIRFQHPASLRSRIESVRVNFRGAKKACFVCGERTHLIRSCLKRRPCLFCQSLEHSSRKCPTGPKCYNCDKYGHMQRKCPEKRRVFSTKKREIVFTKRQTGPRDMTKYNLHSIILSDEKKSGSTSKRINVNSTVNTNMVLSPLSKETVQGTSKSLKVYQYTPIRRTVEKYKPSSNVKSLIKSFESIEKTKETKSTRKRNSCESINLPSKVDLITNNQLNLNLSPTIEQNFQLDSSTELNSDHIFNLITVPNNKKLNFDNHMDVDFDPNEDSDTTESDPQSVDPNEVQVTAESNFQLIDSNEDSVTAESDHQSIDSNENTDSFIEFESESDDGTRLYSDNDLDYNDKVGILTSGKVPKSKNVKGKAKKKRKRIQEQATANPVKVKKEKKQPTKNMINSDTPKNHIPNPEKPKREMNLRPKKVTLRPSTTRQ